MKHWWKDPIIWLMQVSLILLFYLTLVWLVNSYNREFFQVIRDAEYLFANTVRSVEDSLMEQNFDRQLMIRPDSIRRLHRQFLRSDTSQAFILRIMDADSSTESNTKIRHWQRRSRGRDDNGFVGSLALQLSIGRDSAISPEVNHDRLSEEVFEILNERLQREFSEANFAHGYTLHKSEDRLNSLNATKPFTDMLTGVSYFLDIQPKMNSVLGKIVSQIVFAFLTFSMTLLAFIFSYRTLQKQRRLTRIKNDLISNISHELKTPISTVKVALEALDKFKVDEDHAKRREYLDISMNELNRLDLLVDTVLNNSLNEHPGILQMSIVDLKTLFEDILRTMHLQFEKLGAKIQFTCSSESVYIMADQLHMRSVLYNLLDNALKYCDRRPEIKVNLTAESSQVIVSIADNAKGIPKEYLSRIFEKFFRVPSGGLHNIKGYGLGLSYVADVIRQHHGSIRVQSKEGEGSTFIINFPLIDE